MTKILTAFYSSIFCVWAATEYVTPSAIEITFDTLKSDLDLILIDETNPRTVNIQYTTGAVLRMSVLPKPEAKHGKYVKIDGILTIKLKDGSVEEENGLVYENDSFGLTTDQEETSYILIKENPEIEIKPAEKEIKYIPATQLSDDLNGAKKHNQWQNVYQRFFCPDFPIGELTTTLIYDWMEEYLLISTPLKGITIRGAQQLIDTFLDREWYQRGNIGSCDPSPEGSPRGFFREYTNTPAVFFDVWYALKSKRYGSSTGCLGCVDAVRVYDEWIQNAQRGYQAPSVNIEATENRGNQIRERNFEQDMNTAYQLLHDKHTQMKNVIINYADEIVIEVRAGLDEGHPYIGATGTSKAGPNGRKLKNIKAFYDLEKLEYKDQVKTQEEFNPEDYRDKTMYLKYIDWGTFESHLRGTWKALQEGCSLREMDAYAFRVMYADSIRLKYDCQTQTIVLTDVIYLVTDVPGLKKAVISKCRNLRYTNKQQFELQCIDSSAKVIAIQVQPQKVWMQFDEVRKIYAEVFEEEMKTLMGILIKNIKSKDEVTSGTIILDDDMLFEMKFPEGKKRPKNVEVYGNFTQKHSDSVYKKLFFNVSKSAANSGSIGTGIRDIAIDTEYVPFKYYSEGDYVIASKYLTIKTLKEYFEKISAEASMRCAAVKITSFSFKLVQHHTFELAGFYDCSKRIFSIDGKFRALVLTKKDGNTEVSSDRVIDNFVYIQEDNFFVSGSDSLEDVHAISIPKLTDSWEATRESFGAPIQIDENSILVLKSKQIRKVGLDKLGTSNSCFW